MLELDNIVGGILVLLGMALVIGVFHLAAVARSIKLEVDIHTHQLDVIRARLNAFQLPPHPKVTRVKQLPSPTPPRLEN